jgi:hypothetical protein
MQHQNRLASFVALLSVTSPLALMADQTSDVVALETQCEQEREAKIRPLRDMEIAKCKADAHIEADFCEKYWRTTATRCEPRKGP